MPLCARDTVSVSIGAVVAYMVLSNSVSAVEVWSGLPMSFTRPNDVDGTLPENQDLITPNAIIARDAFQGIYNAAYELNFIGTSPEFTAWATNLVSGNESETIEAANWANLTFSTWVDAYDALLHNLQLPGNLIGRSAVLHLTLEDIYLDLEFTSWGSGGTGGFSYLRAEPPAPSGDYNGDLVVNAADYTLWRDTLGETVDNPGDGADGDRSGEIDLSDYDHWKARFNSDVPLGAGSGQASAVPEPSALLLLAGGLLILLTKRRISPRGPGQKKLLCEARWRLS